MEAQANLNHSPGLLSPEPEPLTIAPSPPGPRPAAGAEPGAANSAL
jgi:hypothetical protein